MTQFVTSKLAVRTQCIAVCCLIGLISGCATLEGIGSKKKTAGEADPIAIAERERTDPQDTNKFVLTDAAQSIVGEPQIVFANETDTFSDLARTYGLGYDDLFEANPGIDPWLPGTETPILLPTQFILPEGKRSGIVLNIATKRLFYFPPPVDDEPAHVLTFPIGIGRVGWETPIGETTVVAKAKDPTWWVPASVRKEHAEMGNPLPAVVPPGPDNPLGTRVLKLNMPGYLIHGTNQPYGVGMRVSHGCVRLYPENIEFLYSLIDIGEAVSIINEPYQFGARDGQLYFEAHAPLEDDTMPAAERLAALIEAKRDDAGRPLRDDLREAIHAVSELPDGVPRNVSLFAQEDVYARAPVVHNIVARDPNEPSLEEVREMMEEIEAEIAESETAELSAVE